MKVDVKSEEPRDYGVILEIVVDSKNILVDLNDPKFDAEVILIPGRYNCKIVELFNRKNRKENKDLSFGLYKEVNIDV